MKSNKYLTVLLATIAVVIMAMVLMDYRSNRPGRRGINPYAYDTDSLGIVDEALIAYREDARLKIEASEVRALDYRNGRIYVLADHNLQVMDKGGTLLLRKEFDDPPRCLFAASDNNTIIGFDSYFVLMNGTGEITITSQPENEDSRFTAITANASTIYVADAGNRKVKLYDHRGMKTGEIEGTSSSSSQHGFIVPSPYFDLALSKEGELWVTNPGIRLLQQYNDRGDLMAYWGKASVAIEGFNGCCNPAHIAFLPEGDMVTSEMHLVRIKTYDLSGNFKHVVATPQQFANDTMPPDIAADEMGNILALDLNDKMILFFKPR